jgi:hypothetical protein
MEESCPVADTRNRYEGRGSGDRIARLKAIATREGPKPTNQNSASWNLTKQQGCCNPCDLISCTEAADIQLQGTPGTNDTYTITGILAGSSVIFKVALLDGNCVTTDNCRYSMRFVSPPTISDLTFSNSVTNCGDYLTITLIPIPSSSYSLQITNLEIDYGRRTFVGTPPVECIGGVGDFKIVNLILEYNP